MSRAKSVHRNDVMPVDVSFVPLGEAKTYLEAGSAFTAGLDRLYRMLPTRY